MVSERGCCIVYLALLWRPHFSLRLVDNYEHNHRLWRARLSQTFPLGKVALARLSLASYRFYTQKVSVTPRSMSSSFVWLVGISPAPIRLQYLITTTQLYHVWILHTRIDWEAWPTPTLSSTAWDSWYFLFSGFQKFTHTIDTYKLPDFIVSYSGHVFRRRSTRHEN